MEKEHPDNRPATMMVETPRFCRRPRCLPFRNKTREPGSELRRPMPCPGREPTWQTTVTSEQPQQQGRPSNSLEEAAVPNDGGLASGRGCWREAAGTTAAKKRRGNKKGGKRHRRAQHLHIYFGNSTVFSKKAEQWLFAAPVHVGILVETHLQSQEAQAATTRYWEAGFLPRVSPAIASTDSATRNYGGAMLGTKFNMRSAPLMSDKISATEWRVASCQDLVGTQVLLARGGFIFIFGVYARRVLSMHILEAVATETRSGLHSFILVGDFNDDPADLAWRPWLSANKACIITADQGAPTCVPSRGDPSLLDYVVASEVSREN